VQCRTDAFFYFSSHPGDSVPLLSSLAYFDSCPYHAPHLKEAFVMQFTAVRKYILLLCTLLAAMAMASAQQVFNGTAGDGSLYQFVTPQVWNHQLVLYAHGIVDPQEPIALPSDSGFTTFRDALVAQGFAVGYSSYAANGYAIKEGAQDTDNLRAVFARLVGQPTKTYLVGVSLGGGVVIDLAERFPKAYDGALPMCGLLGGSPLEVEYVGNARVLFDYFFPGVIPGTLLHTPLLPYDPTVGAPPNVGQAVAAALIAGLDPSVNMSLPTLQLADTLGLEAASPTEIITGLIEVMGFDVRYVNDLLDRTHFASPYGNTFLWYSGSLNDRALNAGVERVRDTPEGLEYLLRYYQPTGNVRIPTVTLHTTRDPLVPYWHEAVYYKLASLQHRQGLLVQQSVNRFGHCEFEASEVVHAFSGLVGWVNFGIKPAGGDVTAPSAP
jgi:pimeloyl-ACP methyl ester carboxylesterase